ncbi:MAG: FxsA family protein [Sulfurimonas sp.]|nr:FxsA family protein [Sulfurimonas sp.]
MVYFVIYLFLEVIISVNISSSIGGLMTFLEIMASAFLGIFILMNFKESLKENITAVSYNCIDLNQFQNLNLFTLFGAILLIIPGFLTDIIGLLMQFSVVTRMVVNRYNMRSHNCNINKEEEIKSKKDSNVIDVEIISDNIANK